MTMLETRNELENIIDSVHKLNNNKNTALRQGDCLFTYDTCGLCVIFRSYQPLYTHKLTTRFFFSTDRQEGNEFYKTALW